jgi:hypothetical protein
MMERNFKMEMLFLMPEEQVIASLLKGQTSAEQDRILAEIERGEM